MRGEDSESCVIGLRRFGRGMLGEADGVRGIGEEAIGVPRAGKSGIGDQASVLGTQLPVVRWKVGSRRLVAATIIELEMKDGVGSGKGGIEGALNDKVGLLAFCGAEGTVRIPYRA